MRTNVDTLTLETKHPRLRLKLPEQALLGGLLGVGYVGLRAGLGFLGALVGPSAAREALTPIGRIFDVLFLSAALSGSRPGTAEARDRRPEERPVLRTAGRDPVGED